MTTMTIPMASTTRSSATHNSRKTRSSTTVLPCSTAAVRSCSTTRARWWTTRITCSSRDSPNNASPSSHTSRGRRTCCRHCLLRPWVANLLLLWSTHKKALFPPPLTRHSKIQRERERHVLFFSTFAVSNRIYDIIK